MKSSRSIEYSHHIKEEDSHLIISLSLAIINLEKYNPNLIDFRPSLLFDYKITLILKI
jgi:hypothetical protein